MTVDLRKLVHRYGPAYALVIAMTLLVIVSPDRSGAPSTTFAPTGPSGSPAPINTGSGGTGAADGAAGHELVPGTTDSGSVDVPQDSGSGALASPVAEGGSRPAVDPPPGPDCRPDGRQGMISLYAPPCAPLFTGDNNGGATAKGVSGDKIIVARWIPQSDAGTQALLVGTGITDDRETHDRMYAVLMHYFNTHYETYGREVQYVTVEASGPADDDAAMRADAAKIADEIGAFAMLPNVPGGEPAVLSKELAARGVICFCGVGETRHFYTQYPGYIWADLPVLEENYTHLAEYIGKRLNGKPAQWAGEPTMQSQPRKFGLIYLEGVGVDDRKQARDYFVSELAKYGATLAKDVGYSAADPSRYPEQATNLILQMKTAGVSNLLFVGDPLFPIFLTREATRQAYIPEWLVAGYFVGDTSFFGRTYDQTQWSHAFGISPLPVGPNSAESQPGYQEYHHVCADVEEAKGNCADGDEGVQICCMRSPIEQLFTGIQLAGPNLTAATFAQGMYNFPPTGGSPRATLFALGPDSPTRYEDFTEVFWDSAGRGVDEVGNDAVGIMLKANGGRRFQAGEWTSESAAFDKSRAIFTSDDPALGAIALPHTDDGHRHPTAQRCRSCR